MARRAWWESGSRRQSVKTNRPAEMRFEVSGTGGLKFTSEAGVTYTFKLDNNPVVVNGKTVIAGTMIAFHPIDDHTLESTTTREGVTAAKSTLSISKDGKMLTDTTTLMGPGGNREPTVRIYGKQ